MLFKTFFNYIEVDTIIHKKIFAKEVYYKFLIKNHIKLSKTLILDNFYNFKIPITLEPLDYILKKKTLTGYSLSLQNFYFKNQNNLDYAFKLPFLGPKANDDGHLSSFSANLNSILPILRSVDAKKKKLHFIYILKSVKGGFIVASALGVKGFLPRRQGLIIFSYIFKFRRFLKEKLFLILKKYIFLWLPVHVTINSKIIYPHYMPVPNKDTSTLNVLPNSFLMYNLVFRNMFNIKMKFGRRYHKRCLLKKKKKTLLARFKLKAKAMHRAKIKAKTELKNK